MDDPELLDWCIDVRGRNLQQVDYLHALRIDNLEIVKNYAGNFDYTPRLIAESAAIEGSLMIFQWAIHSYLFKSDHLKSPHAISNIMYNILKNGHVHILEWLESRDDILGSLYFPSWIESQSTFPRLPDNATTGEPVLFLDRKNQWIAATACQVSDICQRCHSDIHSLEMYS